MSVYKKAIADFYKDCNPIKKYYKIPKFLLLIDECFSFVINGSSPHDYINFDFFKLKQRERKKFITFKRKFKIDAKLNPMEYRKYFNDKALFNKTFANFIKRDWLYCKNATNDEVDEFVKSHEKIIVKPIDLCCGEGIYLLDKNNYNSTELIKNGYIIEEFVKQHHALAELNESSVNTVRVYAVVSKNKEVHIIFSALRVGGKGKVVDNYHGGGSGYQIDVESGVIINGGKRNFGNELIKFIPGTNKQIIGFKIPMWDELKSFVKKAAMVVEPCRFIAWDVAITETGFELIEGNHHGDNDFLQSMDQVPKYPLLKSFLK